MNTTLTKTLLSGLAAISTTRAALLTAQPAAAMTCYYQTVYVPVVSGGYYTAQGYWVPRQVRYVQHVQPICVMNTVN
ncbi:hypothetical protein [Trichothermofontia sp.]